MAKTATKKKPGRPTLPIPATAAPPEFRDRIKELRRVPASELLADPRNWREHPDEQRKGLKAMLTEVGLANAVLAREDAEGKLVLIDGHLRGDIVGDAQIPVLVLDVNEEEAGKLLATLDPLAAMAKVNEEKMAKLLGQLHFETPAVNELLVHLSELAGIEAPDADAGDDDSAGEQDVAGRYALLIDCADEAEQQLLLERFEKEGIECRALVV